MSEYTIISLDESTWCIDEGNVRFFLLAGSESALLIDSGMQIKNAKEIAEGLTDLPIRLLNTHGDPDHIGSNAEFEEFYMNPAEAGNYYKDHQGTGSMLPVEDKDILELGNRTLEIIALPGHTAGSIAVLDQKNRFLFSGDPIQDGTIFMFGVRREMHAYISSLDKVQRMQDRFDCIYPSHGSFPVTAKLLPLLKKGAEEILNGHRQGVATEWYGNTIYRYEVEGATFLYDK